jgi:hypothetical protein
MLKQVYTNASREFVKYKLQLSFVFDKSRHHFVLYKLVSLSAIGPPLLTLSFFFQWSSSSNSLLLFPMVLLRGGWEAGGMREGGFFFSLSLYLSAAARYASSR